jgi:hypothetical protein
VSVPPRTVLRIAMTSGEASPVESSGVSRILRVSLGRRGHRIDASGMWSRGARGAPRTGGSCRRRGLVYGSFVEVTLRRGPSRGSRQRYYEGPVEAMLPGCSTEHLLL